MNNHQPLVFPLGKSSHSGQLLLAAFLLLAACSLSPTVTPHPTAITALPATASAASTNTVTVPSVPTTPFATPTPTPPPKTSLCSPLKDISLEELPGIISNPYAAPAPGMDDGHHGVDLGFYRFGDHVGMRGWPVLSSLAGKVAGVILDRPPYGNAILIETPLDELPNAWLPALQIPEPVSAATPSAALSCPTATPAAQFPAESGRSLYILYAHFDQPPLLKTGDTVACGQQIGVVGTSGMSVNEHLHFELRAGTSGATFSTMAHYDTSTTPEEMASYCIWRISGQFQLLDPMKLLSIQP